MAFIGRPLFGADGAISIRTRGPSLPRLYVLPDQPEHFDTIFTIDGGLGNDGLKELPSPAF